MRMIYQNQSELANIYAEINASFENVEIIWMFSESV